MDDINKTHRLLQNINSQVVSLKGLIIQLERDVHVLKNMNSQRCDHKEMKRELEDGEHQSTYICTTCGMIC